MPSPLETARAGFYYPSITYGTGSPQSVVAFTTPANPLLSIGRVKAENISLSGFQETLSVRVESRITLGFTILSHDVLEDVEAWWEDWASLGEQSVLVLDRFNTCSGMYEYDNYNTFFTRAHCLYNPFEPRRFTPSRELWTLQLVFRQGQDESA